MNLADVRRLSVSSLAAAILLLLWLFSLVLHEEGVYEWSWPEAGLSTLTLLTWLWISIIALLVIVGVNGFIIFGVQQAPEDYVRGSVRQVQCQSCKAVFFVHDTGHRPITHRCPNCKRLGVYDGKAPPVGRPPRPEPPKRIIQLDLNCQACANRFPVTDTGARPLKVTCPHCGSRGKVL